MIAQLSDLSEAAEPTAFHNVLRALDNRGRLLRVYTQNIDALEQKCGLSFGVPEFDGKRSKPKSKGKIKAATGESANLDVVGSVRDVKEPQSDCVAVTDRLPSPPVEVPRCIPLHGTLQSMHCQVCNHAFPLSEYIPLLASGLPPQCPECTTAETARQLIGKRPRKIGRLRPSVVLYNEAHKDGEGVGEVVRKDLLGCSKGKGKSGADLLLVVGTSLKVPGTKRMVREFSKAVKARGSPPSSNKADSGSNSYALRSSTGLLTPASSPRRSPTADEDCQLPKALYLNFDFPAPTREWDGVFDAWIQGDAQAFAKMLQAEIDKEAKLKEVAIEKKRKREGEAVASGRDELSDFGRVQEQEQERKKHEKKSQKHKLGMDNRRSSAPQSPKKRKVTVEPPSPPSTPPSSPRSDTLDSLPGCEEDLNNCVVVGASSKLYLRLPARRQVPEVVITPAAPRTIRPSLTSNHPKSPLLRVPRQYSPSSTTRLLQFDKRTKAGRKALREAQRARKAERLAQVAASVPIPIPPPPHQPYFSHLRTHHQESFIRTSAHQHPDQVDLDIRLDEPLPYQLLARTALLGLM